MKLTKLQRYTAYCILLAEAQKPSMIIGLWGDINKSTMSGICFMFSSLVGEDYYSELSKILPELNNKRKCTSAFWFYNWEQRIAALEACIEETHP